MSTTAELNDILSIQEKITGILFDQPSEESISQSLSVLKKSLDTEIIKFYKVNENDLSCAIYLNCHKNSVHEYSSDNRQCVTKMPGDLFSKIVTGKPFILDPEELKKNFLLNAKENAHSGIIIPLSGEKHLWGFVFIGQKNNTKFNHNALLILQGILTAISSKLFAVKSEQLQKLNDFLSDELETVSSNFQAIFDAAPFGMLLIDKNYNVVSVNDYTTKMFGYNDDNTPFSAPGNLICCISRHDDIKGCGFGPHCQTCEIRNAYTTTLKKNLPVKNEIIEKEVEMDGTLAKKWFIFNSVPVYIHSELHALLTLQDITERVKTETKLKKSEERYKTLVEDMPVFVTRFTKDLKLSFINRVFAEYIGLPVEKIVNKNLNTYLPKQDIDN